MLGINPSRGRLKEILYMVKHRLLEEDNQAMERLSTEHLRLLLAIFSKSKVHGSEPLLRFAKDVLMERKLSRADIVSLVYNLSKMRF